jgi:hypothetical protein
MEMFNRFKPISPQDIPTIALYMDQVTGFLDETLQSFKVESEDKVFTKTMINNYVKSGILDKPVKKKYDQSQLMQLIMIYHFKNILSLPQIGKFFELSLAELGSFENLYALFYSVQLEVLEAHNIEKTSSNRIHRILKLVFEADIKKRIAITEIQI